MKNLFDIKNLFFQRSLKFYLIVFIVLPFTLLVSALSFLSIRYFSRELETRMKEDVELVARALKKPISQAIRTQIDDIPETLSSVLDIRRLYGIYIYDNKGSLILARGPDVPIDDQKAPQRTIEKWEQHGEYTPLQKREAYSFFVPLGDSLTQNLGVLQVSRKRSDIEAEIKKMQMAMIVAILIFIFIILGAIYLFAKRLIDNPIQNLLSGFEELGKDEFNIQITIPRTYEFGLAAQGFNNMLLRLKDAKQEAEKHRKEQWQWQHRLQQTQKLAAIGRLSAGVAHELGNPLSVIDGKVQRAERQIALSRNSEGVLKEKILTENFLKEISQETRKMTEIIRNLLSFARHNSSPKNSQCQVITCLQESLKSLEQLTKGVSINYSKDSPDLCIQGDSLKVEQIMSNLIKNALDEIKNLEKPQLDISWKKENEWAIIIVDDNGPGIPKNKRAKVFEPFYTTKRPGRGTGLGLSVVHGHIEDLNGIVSIKDSPLGGARFKIKIPLNKENNNDFNS